MHENFQYCSCHQRDVVCLLQNGPGQHSLTHGRTVVGASLQEHPYLGCSAPAALLTLGHINGSRAHDRGYHAYLHRLQQQLQHQHWQQWLCVRLLHHVCCVSSLTCHQPRDYVWEEEGVLRVQEWAFLGDRMHWRQILYASLDDYMDDVVIYVVYFSS